MQSFKDLSYTTCKKKTQKNTKKRSKFTASVMARLQNGLMKDVTHSHIFSCTSELTGKKTVHFLPSAISFLITGTGVGLGDGPLQMEAESVFNRCSLLLFPVLPTQNTARGQSKGQSHVNSSPRQFPCFHSNSMLYLMDKLDFASAAVSRTHFKQYSTANTYTGNMKY